MIAEIVLAVAMASSGIAYPVSDNTDWKPYEDYRCITDTTSPQYKLLQRAVHEDNGLLTIDGDIAVALGQAWGEVGDRITFTLEHEGKRHSVRVVIADSKQYAHTQGGAGWHGHNGHTIEAIVNTDLLDAEARTRGSVDAIPILDGEIVKAVRE